MCFVVVLIVWISLGGSGICLLTLRRFVGSVVFLRSFTECVFYLVTL